ncbi:MAG: VOC family protein [Deltaproteobacteria bacterium]|jgi:catechol 2,3-dioxygenase-like lactoylglutathione lyase family enzyme|nr:VOC family protein [Deltaproteobacteria bacterium]
MFKQIKRSNIILYCTNWKETVHFYRDILCLPVNFSNEWFFEFILSSCSRLSIADEKRTSRKSRKGKGIIITLEVHDVEAAYESALNAGINPTMVKNHPWGARLFYLTDPEGCTIEIWQPSGHG